MDKAIDSKHILSTADLQNHSKIYAGPGAGKTYFLVENIKNIITTNEIITNSKARKVLCITYTNAAVDEIRRRLERYIDYVETYTIHGFIIEHIIKPFQNELINIMKQDFGISVSNKQQITSQIEGFNILHGINKEDIYDFIKNTNPEQFETYQFNYTKKIMSEVEVDNKIFLESIKEDGEPKYILKASNKIIQEHIIPIKEYIWSKVRKLTHDEILYFGYRILKNNPLAVYSLRVKFPFIFVDEFQDTNPLQTLIVKLIGYKSTKIIIVGDIAQSIYSFQGANPNDLIDFSIEPEYDKTYVITGNRRSTENIVNFCNFIRQEDKTVIQTSIKQYNNEENKISIESKQIHFLVDNSKNYEEIISNILEDGGVILTRTWAAAFKYIRNIDETQSKLLKDIYNSYYNTSISIKDEITGNHYIAWVRAFRFIFKLWEGFKKGSFIDIAYALQWYFNIRLSNITPRLIFQFSDILKTVFHEISECSLTKNIIDKFNDKILNGNNIDFKQFFNEDIKISLFDEQEEEKRIKNISALQWDVSYKLFTEVFSENSKYMTIHQAKGLEWDKVFVSIELSKFDKFEISNVFQNPQVIGEKNFNEFVRIFYVACSRAREDLYIHIPSGCSIDIIESNLNKYIKETGLKLEYEFL